jgi:hypothetical protein
VRHGRWDASSFGIATIWLSIAAQKLVDFLGEIRYETPLLRRAVLERARDSTKTIYESVCHSSLRFQDR